LGVGSHVDHLITFAVARDLLADAVQFYEDLPYAIKPGALEQRLAALEDTFTSQIVSLAEGSLQVKLNAIQAYASQMDALFGGAEAMVHAMRAYAQSARLDTGAFGERLWRF
jgi:LmbE family N-acetylglucosaminyl deacetylase